MSAGYIFKASNLGFILRLRCLPCHPDKASLVQRSDGVLNRVHFWYNIMFCTRTLGNSAKLSRFRILLSMSGSCTICITSGSYLWNIGHLSMHGCRDNWRVIVVVPTDRSERHSQIGRCDLTWCNRMTSTLLGKRTVHEWILFFITLLVVVVVQEIERF